MQGDDFAFSQSRGPSSISLGVRQSMLIKCWVSQFKVINLNVLRVLKRGGVPPADLRKVYFALIRSVLEYCCPMWHNALPVRLSDSIERVQKRALRISFPALHYQEALATTACVPDFISSTLNHSTTPPPLIFFVIFAIVDSRSADEEIPFICCIVLQTKHVLFWGARGFRFVSWYLPLYNID